MKNRGLQSSLLPGFAQALRAEEKSEATTQKYLRDVRVFLGYTAGRRIDKELTIVYKEQLAGQYAVNSANSMIAAANCFLRYIGRPDRCVKQFKTQKQLYCPEEKELTRAEYARLVRAAKSRHSERLTLLLETICATGIRVSELQYITAQAVSRGEAAVTCKGKTRTVWLPLRLQKKLRQYLKQQRITVGPVFITRTGRPMNRSNIWREMKALCERAGVAPTKVFPHALRYLFARTFYGIEKDIAKLADLLGHSSINTTRIYIATTGAEHRRKLEAMHLIL